MSVLQIENNNTPQDDLPILRLGFRPFFLMAGISAVVLMLSWLYFLGHTGPAIIYGAVGWHAHEMIFGYTVAVIAGFLLTAEKNWTGMQTLNGAWLGVFALLWLAGRFAPWMPLPAWLSAALDLVFLPALALAIVWPLLKTSQYQHMIFAVIVALLFSANLLFHLGYLYPDIKTTEMGIRFGWMTIIFLITVMGGRVIPFFIERGTGKIDQTRKYRSVEIGSMVSLLVWMFLSFTSDNSVTIAYLACIAGAFQLVRWQGWHIAALWREPMLWILYLGYGWIPVGLFAYAYAGFTDAVYSPALHAFTAGGIGLLTMGMMARVSLGHTGRNMRASSLVVAAFVSITLGSIVRVIGPLFFPAVAGEYYAFMLNSAGMLWALGFLLFVIVFIPILIRPRVDGRPG
jgi:uncharacterized protein involved in response to NO